MRIFAISDIHADYAENKAKIEAISNNDCQQDMLIVAGDTSSKLSLVILIMRTLKFKFKEVFYVPGNHDLWLDDHGFVNSFDKFNRLLKELTEEGIETKPFRVGRVVLLPVVAWYDYSFGVPKAMDIKNWLDFKRCKWPVPLTLLTDFFIGLTDSIPVDKQDLVITYSHFLPRYDFLPIRLINHIPHIIPFLGSTLIEEKIRGLGSNIHVCGHLHYNFNVEKEGVTYVNNALGYPHEYREDSSLLIQLV